MVQTFQKYTSISVIIAVYYNLLATGICESSTIKHMHVISRHIKFSRA